MEDPNFIQTDIFSFMEEKPKRRRTRVKKETAPKEAATISEKPISVKPISKEETPTAMWQEKVWEFDLTVKSQDMKDAMKAAMVEEGFTKREANHIFKGLFFKEKICNTKAQALEYLRSVPTSYAVKYKIGIEPSPKMISLKKRLDEKEARLATYSKEQNEKKFKTDFVSCPHCKSKVNGTFITPPQCPVCGEDMRSDTAVKTIHTLEETVQDLRKRYEDAARKYNSKFTGGEKWIVRLVNQ